MSDVSVSVHPEAGPPVVVGVDGSTTCLSAVDLAAHEARLRGLRLHIVHAFIWPLFGVRLGPSPTGPPDSGLRNAAEGILAEAAERARIKAPGGVVTTELSTGAPAPVLLHHAKSASLVVVGDRGLGGFTGLLVGSTAVQLAAYATCPILVARGRADPVAPILLGLDGSPANRPAVEYAFELAALHGVPLIALHAWEDRPVPPRNATHEALVVEAEESEVLTQVLADERTRYPTVKVELIGEHASPRTALIAASQEAQFVVLGSRGRGGFAGLLFGSVSQAVLHHAGCPVAIVPHRQTSEVSAGSGSS